ncbi:sulfotransferase [Halieaceae bacterium IMCC8485]|uniref:Sulfotransferase n=2 Tax=Candidatus Seongchinamella marina TaxID=2518990 RepID=A0ABT3SZI0_9GAMM|nr:sulfotransferase [Candidatus Seongchinamella marina]
MRSVETTLAPKLMSMLFYFDFDNYFKMLRLAWGEPSLRVRSYYLAMLLLYVPLVSTFHAICFALDPILFPSLRRTDVSNPVFIIGHGRSGTTLTFRLMDRDEGRFSSFLLWECYFPSLLQKKAIRAIAAIDRPWLGGMLGRMVERFEEKRYGPSRHMHEMGLCLPEEDDISLFYSMAAGLWMTKMPWMGELDFYYVDTWPGKETVKRRQKKGHKQMVFYKELVRRQLCLNGGSKVHLSKNPYWTGRTQTLIDVFPDARFVLNLRDPREAVPSLIKLTSSGWKQMGWSPERVQASIDMLTKQSVYNYRHPLEVFDNNPGTRYAILHYAMLKADPAAAIEAVYRDLDMPVTQRYFDALQTLGTKQKKHSTTFRYSLEEFGLDERWIDTEFGDLFERFGWAKDIEE